MAFEGEVTYASGDFADLTAASRLPGGVEGSGTAVPLHRPGPGARRELRDGRCIARSRAAPCRAAARAHKPRSRCNAARGINRPIVHLDSEGSAGIASAEQCSGPGTSAPSPACEQCRFEAPTPDGECEALSSPLPGGVWCVHGPGVGWSWPVGPRPRPALTRKRKRAACGTRWSTVRSRGNGLSAYLR